MRATTLASLVVMLGCLGIEAADAQNYTLTDLGNLGGKIVSASAISNNGIVVGQSSIAGNDGSSFVFEWKNGVITKLDGLDSTFSQAYGVNSAGEVVGFTLDAHDLGRAFLYSDGVFSFPAGSSESSAYGINESGEVVGGYDPNVAAEQPFIYSDGMLATIAVNGAASAINNAGQVVGGTYSGEAFLYADGVITNLGQVSAQAINDKSQIIGGNGLSCYLSTDGKRKTLGSLYPKGPCHALALNNVGTVVGSAGVKNSNRYHAFIYKDGAFSDLNSMVVGPLKPYVVLGLASGINDSGQIAATGDDSRHPDEIHAYLVSPVLPLAIACPAAAAKVGTVYDSRPVVTGGVEPYTFSIVEGTLPNGLSLDFNTGAIIGTPTTVAKYQFEIQVTDSSQTADGTATQTCSIDVTQGHPPARAHGDALPSVVRHRRPLQLANKRSDLAQHRQHGDPALAGRHNAGRRDPNARLFSHR